MARLEDFIRLNKGITEIAKETAEKLRTSIALQNPQSNDVEGDLMEDLRVRTGMRDGIVDKMSIKFHRYGVFYGKGVGKGTKISQVGTTKRRPKDWFNPVMREQFNKVVDLVTDVGGDIAISSVTKILIN